MILLASALLLAFQNCTKLGSPNSGKPGSDTQSLSGGEGYDGKLFVNRGPVCADGSDVQSAVLVKGPHEAYLMREECVDVSKRPLTDGSFSYMPHNFSNLVYSNEAFDVDPKISKDIRATTWLCRGFETAAVYQQLFGLTMPATFNDRWADFVFKPDSSSVTGNVGRLLFGLYEQGSVEKLAAPVYDSGEFPALIETSAGPTAFSGTDADGHYFNFLAAQAADGTLAGKFVYIRPSTLPPPGPNDLPDFNLYVTCYPQ